MSERGAIPQGESRRDATPKVRTTTGSPSCTSGWRRNGRSWLSLYTSAVKQCNTAFSRTTLRPSIASALKAVGARWTSGSSPPTSPTTTGFIERLPCQASRGHLLSFIDCRCVVVSFGPVGPQRFWNQVSFRALVQPRSHLRPGGPSAHYLVRSRVAHLRLRCVSYADHHQWFGPIRDGCCLQACRDDLHAARARLS